MLPPHKVRLNKKSTTLRLTMIFKQPLKADGVVQSPTANANLCNLIEKTLLWSVEVNFLPWTTVEFLLYLHNSFV